MSTAAAHDGPYLDAEARRRLDDLTSQLEDRPDKIATIFPAAARVVARGPADPDDPEGIRRPRLEDQARVALLHTVAKVWRDDPGRLTSEIANLYWYGDADEKRAVLHALATVSPESELLLPLIDDALRTNDIRLVAAALGDYGASHLSPEAWRQGVLKCLFVGVPLEAVSQLDERADADLARMVADFCKERAAAGRDLPSDAWRVLDRFPDAAQAVTAMTTTEA
jgi:hypothetical protein